MLVFMYGSNLNLDDYAAGGWCAAHLQPRERAWLPDHELRFSRKSERREGGVLSVVPAIGSVVPGMLFEVNEAGILELDRKEGHPRAYRQTDVWVITETGHTLRAMAYVAHHGPRSAPPFYAPNPDYLHVVQQGMLAFGVQGLDMLAAAAQNKPPPTGVSGVFVYGTLLRGESRRVLLDNAPTTPASVQGSLVDLGAYPGLTFGNDHVHGELVKVSGRAIGTLDRVEGFLGWGVRGSLYERTLIKVFPDQPPAWTYHYPHSGGTPIPHGSWRGRMAGAAATPGPAAIARLREEIKHTSHDSADPPSGGDPYWGGARVVVTDTPPVPPHPDDDPWSRHASTFFLVSPHAGALSWLFTCLVREVQAEISVDKYTFYRQIATAADAASPKSERAVLTAALNAAARYVLA